MVWEWVYIEWMVWEWVYRHTCDIPGSYVTVIRVSNNEIMEDIGMTLELTKSARKRT